MLEVIWKQIMDQQRLGGECGWEIITLLLNPEQKACTILWTQESREGKGSGAGVEMYWMREVTWSKPIRGPLERGTQSGNADTQMRIAGSGGEAESLIATPSETTRHWSCTKLVWERQLLPWRLQAVFVIASG